MPKIEKLYDMECRNELGDMMSKQGMEQNENKQYSKLLHGGISVRNFKEVHRLFLLFASKLL